MFGKLFFHPNETFVFLLNNIARGAIEGGTGGGWGSGATGAIEGGTGGG